MEAIAVGRSGPTADGASSHERVERSINCPSHAPIVASPSENIEAKPIRPDISGK
jgi:hypothetical protein